MLPWSYQTVSKKAEPLVEVRMSSIIRSACLLVFLNGLAGCETLYNAKNDKTAQDASKAFDDAGIGKALETERSVLIKNQAERQALVSRSQLAIRDESIVRLLDGTTVKSTWDTLQSMTDERITKIAGGADIKLGPKCFSGAKPTDKSGESNNTTVAAQLHNARFNLASALENAEQKKSQIAVLMAGIEDPVELSCSRSTVLPAHLQGNSELAGMVTLYDSECATANEITSCFADLSSKQKGLIFEKNQTINEIEKYKAQIATEVSAARRHYKDLFNQADNSKPMPGAAKQLADNLEAALADLGKAQEKVKPVQSIPVLSTLAEPGKLAALTEKEKVLDAYINALSGKGVKNETVGQHRVLLVSKLVNKISGRPAPPTAGILMEAEFTRQQIAAAQTRTERAAEAERILRNQLGYLLDELEFLLESQANLTQATPKCRGMSIYTALDSGTSNPCSLLASKALLSFAAAWTAGRVPVEQGDYLLIDQTELAALDASEAALTQTEGVVRTAVTQIAALHASGIKPEHLAALVQAISLPAIAVRVK